MRKSLGNVGLIALMLAGISLGAAPARAQSETVIATDDFNRADETPLVVGGNWQRPFTTPQETQTYGIGSVNLTGDRVSATPGEALYFWQGAGTFDNTRQFARARVLQTEHPGLVLLGGAGHAIVTAWYAGDVYIFWYKDNDSFHQPLKVSPSVIQPGDIVESDLVDGIIYVKVNGTVVASVANTSPVTTGSPGFETFMNPTVNGATELDDWEAGTPTTYSISGAVTENSIGLSGVLITATGGYAGTATTNGSGTYSISGIPAGVSSIVLTPTLSGHTLTPSSITVNGPMAADVTGQDFVSGAALLTIHAANGSVTKSPDQPMYNVGVDVTLTPVANAGFAFVGWSGDVPAGHETDNPLTVTMSQDRNITASFAPPGFIAFDDFNRANETPFAIGGNWQRALTGGSSNLSGNQVVGASNEAVYYWQGAGTFDNSAQFARATVTQANGHPGLVLLGANNQAIVAAWDRASATLYIYWYSSGVYQGNLTTVASTIQDGDVIEAALVDGVIVAKVNGAVIASATNTTSLTSGRPGFETYLAGGAIDDWEAGTLSTHTIGGTITENAAGLSGVLVTASGGFVGSATTDANGAYTLLNVPSDAVSIVLTPTLSGHIISPTTRTVAGPLASDVTGQDFTSSPNNNESLTILATHGTVTRAPDQAIYVLGTNVTLTPVPDAGYRFVGWSGDVPAGHESDAPLTVTMSQSRTIKASFMPPGLIAADDFNRPNESPLAIGGDWQRAMTVGASNLTGNQVVGASNEAVYYWQGAGTFDNARQFARETVTQANGHPGLVLLGANNQAIVTAWDRASATLYIYWYSSGVYQGNLTTLPSTLQDGDVIEADLDGGVISAKINGSVVASVANTTSLSSGRPGFETYLAGGALDDWKAGTPALQIAASAGAGGSITPSGSVSVEYGASQAFTITPNSNYHVADVLVDGASAGVVTTHTFTNVIANHTIAASFAIDTHTLTASAGTNGTISPNGVTTVDHGTSQAYTIIPAAHYHVADVVVDGASVGAVTTYTFSSVTANHTIAASFAIDTYTLAASAGTNGSIAPTGAATVDFGTDHTYTITPDAHYHIADVLVDGVSIGAVGTYTFTGVAANHTIAASFAIDTYTLTASAGADGNIAPSGVTTVNFGSGQAYTITPSANYHVADVLVDGVSVGAVSTYTFSNVSANHTIAASFTIDTYTLTASAGANGSIAPNGVTTVDHGTDQTYTITADAHYHIADVVVDGVSVGAVGTYTFTGVAANHTVAASFAIDTYTLTASAGANGSIAPTGVATVDYGTSHAYTITAAGNYHIADVLVDGVSVGAVGSYTFTDVAANHTIAASFTIDTYTLTASAGANGSISPNGVATVDFGTDHTYSITPNVNFHVVDVVVDGVSVGPVTSYSFTGVSANHTIAATFTIDTYTLTASAGANGNITPNGGTIVNHGADETYTITPAVHYHIADVLVDGVSVGAVATYTFTGVSANHTIAASFTIDTYTLTASVGANGSIAPTGVATVDYGTSHTYTITPAANYHIADVLVDGVSIGAVTTYAFSNVSANHTIAASFTIDTYTLTASAGANGSIAPTGVATVDFGTNHTYTITPAANYHIADVLVDGVSVGAVTTYAFSDVSANHTIAASFTIDTYTLTASAGANGSIAPTGVATVDFGTSHTYTITPAANYHIADVLVDGVSVGAAGTYTFTGVAANHTIAASFTIDTYTLTASAGANGSIAPNGVTTVDFGATQIYTITPTTGYHVADVLVDGVSVGAVTSYSFNAVAANHTIAASFAINTYTLTASAGANGSIAPNGATSVDYGANQGYTITPAAHYHVADVLVDGVSIGAVTTYTFSNLTANHTIAVSFTIDTYTLTATAGANGSIAPAGVTTANFDTDQAYTIAPTTGYHVADVLVDGVSVGAVTTYTFSAVAANHTIAASFAINTFTLTASAGANGSIAPNGVTTLDYGAGQSYSMTAATGYHVADVLVDGASVGPVTAYTFSNVTASHTIAASFAINTYPINAAAVGNGSVSPSGVVSVTHGADQSFTITPSAGYHVGALDVDGVLQTVTPGVMTFAFTNVTTSRALTATFVQNPPVAALTALAASQLKSGNDTDGTTRITLTWPATPAGTTVAVYRSSFGNYPLYDDAPNAGSVPAAPSYPPSAAWTLTTVTAPGQTDESSTRDYYYYAAFVTDIYGTVSPVSNVTTGTLNYDLGDVSDGAVAGHGDDRVNLSDISLLGAHYGLTGVAAAAFSYLDVGPTLDHSVNTRPVTDGAIDFDDLVMFALNYNSVSIPQDAIVVASASDALTLQVPDSKLGDLKVSLQMHGTGQIQAVSTKLSWDPAIVTPVSFAPGALLGQEEAAAFSGKEGVIDVARLGLGHAGLVGDGELATVTFKRLALGDPKIAIAGIDARSAQNQAMTMAFGTAQHPVIPAVTSFDRVAPNPFRGTTTLVFSLAKPGPVDLAIFSVDGRLVRSLVRETKAAGMYSLQWDGQDDGGRAVSAGVYYVRLLTPQGHFSRSMVNLK